MLKKDKVNNKILIWAKNSTILLYIFNILSLLTGLFLSLASPATVNLDFLRVFYVIVLIPLCILSFYSLRGLSFISDKYKLGKLKFFVWIAFVFSIFSQLSLTLAYYIASENNPLIYFIYFSFIIAPIVTIILGILMLKLRKQYGLMINYLSIFMIIQGAMFLSYNIFLSYQAMVAFQILEILSLILISYIFKKEISKK